MNNMFTTSCFIRKNTPELRKKLEELGYTNGAWESPHFEYPYLSTWPNPKFGLFKGDGFYMTEDDYRFDGKVWEYKPKEGVIDCGTNEELFLALAALRDDTNENQWFIAQDTMWDENYNGEITVYYEEGEWLIWDYYSFMEDMPSSFRKATVEEIIEHFK